MEEMKFDKSVFFDMSYGMYILGVMDGDRPTGCVVNTVFQITSEPSVVAVSVNHGNYTNGCIKKTGMFTVNILSESVPQEVIGTFGFKSGKDTDKFAAVPYAMNEAGLPILPDYTCGTLTCKVVDSAELSTHTVFFAQVIGGIRRTAGDPMTYSYYHKVKNGKAPKNAPTYLKDEDIPKAAPAEKWVCSVCGYVYDGSKGPFENLPNEWKCPVCGAPKEMFKKK